MATSNACKHSFFYKGIFSPLVKIWAFPAADSCRSFIGRVPNTFRPIHSKEGGFDA
jgi:hypothetical protein